MKRFISFLSTVLTEKRETTVGYRIYNLLFILILVIGLCVVTKNYYKAYEEKQVVEYYLDAAYSVCDKLLAERDSTYVISEN